MPLLEQPGWHGFALPRLERLHGPLVGTIVLGVLWALWHLPEFWVPSWAASSGGGVLVTALFLVLAVAFAIVIPCVFNNARAGLPLAILVHPSLDAFGSPLGEIFPTPAASSSLPLLVVFGALAVVLMLFTRGRLGYRPDAAAASRVR